MLDLAMWECFSLQLVGGEEMLGNAAVHPWHLDDFRTKKNISNMISMFLLLDLEAPSDQENRQQDHTTFGANRSL